MTTPTENNQVAELLKLFRAPELTPEQKAEIEKKRERYRTALNWLYNTEQGELIIKTFMAHCKYWDAVSSQPESEQKKIQVEQEMVRSLILRHLTTENLTDLISKTRKEA